MNGDIEYMMHDSGRPAWAHIIVDTPEGRLLECYGNPVALKQYRGSVVLDSRFWDYSVTTHKFRGRFLGENTATTRRKLERGEYRTANLTELLGKRVYTPGV